MDDTLALHELSFVPEGDEVVVGRLDTGEYVVLPADGAELLRRMCAGMPPRAAADWYRDEYGEPVDIDDFVASLHELGFVRPDDGEAAAAPAPPVRFRRLGRALLGPYAAAGYAALVVLGLLALARHPDLRPSPAHIFFTGSLIVVQLVITFGQVPLLFLHEGAHILAGARLGLPSTLRMSNRLTYIVFETSLNGLLSVPRRRRYLPFLAGMACDVVVLAVLDLVADLTRAPDGGPSLTGRVCLALGFTVVMRLAWQFQLYLRTDLYYVFATAFNCHDLHDAGKTVLRNRLWRLLGRPGRVRDESRWTARDRRVGAWYGPFIVLGVGVFVAVTVFGSLPVVVQYFSTAAEGLASGRWDTAFWDAVFSLGINVAQVTLLVVLSRRKRREQAGTPHRSLLAQGAQ